MIGTVVGNYRIERELSEAGMSQIYIGRTLAPTSLLPEGYLVVVKVMAAELAGEVTAKKRFVKEAQILAQLRHRYITRFYEFLPRDEGAVLVMEFVDGKPVDRLITERGALAIPEAVSITQCLLEALSYAHGKGIIHRDIKPANLIQQKTGGIKVTDFGIAKIKEGNGSGSGATVLTKAGFLLGTPHYMSAEQIKDPKEAGALCDIYSSGVVLYEMLTGTLPFNQRSLAKLIEAIYRGDKQPPSSLNSQVDSSMDALVLRSLHVDPRRRFQSAQEFHAALEQYKQARLNEGPQVLLSPDDATVRAGSPEAVKRWDLVSVRDGEPERHPLEGEEFTIGRDRSCSVVLSHPAISRRHARITVSGSSFQLEDLKSANGTYVNNTRVERASLKPGDVVRFGADPTCSYTIRSRAV